MIVDHTKHQEILSRHPHTDDGFIHVVGGIVKDNNGNIYLHHDARRNEFLLPGGKVEYGESFEQALIRELKEELDIDIISMTYISSVKYIAGLKRCFHTYQIDSYHGIPLNNDSQKYDQYRAKLIDSDNELGFAVKVNGTITDDIKDIMHSFLDIYHRKIVVPARDDEIALRAMYRPYDQSWIDTSKSYYVYLDSEKEEYFLSDIYL